MQEYIQDALTFVREYGRPCLFITFTCNPKWPEITSLLLPGQNSIHRHDITARVFRQKLKSLISFITKSHVFGPTRCWMYSVEWQKRGLPHAHILVWFIDKIRPEEIDSIISAEIPDPSTDQLLFDIVTTNMIHGPCGTLNSSSPCMADETGYVKLPTDFCTIADSQDTLIEQIFPDVHTQYINHEWLAERAILAAKNVDVDNFNLKIQMLLPGNLVSYKSIDTVCDDSEAVNFPTEFLNSLDLPGMPPHNLQLKVGSPIILLRNLNPPRLCNGTRLVIQKLMKNVIEARILNGKFRGENILIPRIPIIPTDVPIQFKRIQFPIRLAFAMTINKSQGQTMSVCGLDLRTPCFSHGQLYVACSRVGKPSSLFVLAKDGLTKTLFTL
ncbi:ATP-dependent DNA helicase [Trichonephila clavipes]|nr:ATP-dependent DNA helicase [Trichonephila clavipes]